MNLTEEAKKEAFMHLEEILEVLLDMTTQHCLCGGKLDSMAISTNADAIRILEKLGLASIEKDAGRRVIATVKGEQ